jgi:hypothetical protein
VTPEAGVGPHQSIEPSQRTYTRDRLPPPARLAVLTVNWVAAFLAAYVPTRRLLSAWGAQSNEWWSYQASEWLINFGGGPVRRGLAGYVFTQIPVASARTVVTWVVIAVVVAVAVLFALLIAMVITKSQSAAPLLLWGIPGGVLLGLWQGQWIDLPESVLLFATRKEQAFFLVLLLFTVLVARRRFRLTTLALTYGLAMFVLAFVHEGLAFVYAIAGAWLFVTADVLTSTGRIGLQQLRVAARVLVPPAVGVLFTVPFASPDRQQLEGMWSAIDPETRGWLGNSIPVPFELMSYSLPEAFEYARQAVLNPRGVWLWFLLAVVVLGWTLVALWVTDTSRDGVRYTLLTLALMLAAVAPLLLVAIDWGRFIVIVALNTATLVVARQLLNPATVRPATLGWRTAAVVTVLLAVLSVVGIPEAGAPFGE